MKQKGIPFEALLEAAPDAIIGVDATGAIRWLNAQTEILFGYDRHELIGENVEILVPESARAVHPRHRERYRDQPVARPMGAGNQLLGRRRDGSVFPAEISLSAIETDGDLLVSAAVRDVTEQLEFRAAEERLRSQAERQDLERQLQQAQRLESLGQLAGGVAHDFNNLLGAILNYASFVSKELGRIDDDRCLAVLDDVAQIRRSAERGAELTHQLLAFGRREVVRPELIDIGAVIRDVEGLLSRSLGEHIQLEISLPPAPVVVLADRGQLEQVLVNVAVNARDAMENGGTLSIDAAIIDVDAGVASNVVNLEPGRYVRIEMADTGIGMPPEVAERAFEPFFTTKPKGSGTGLGLATVYGIIRQADGVVQVVSEPDRGTTIIVHLPTQEAKSTDSTSPIGHDPGGQVDVDLPHGSGETVLVVEDEEGMLDVTSRILSEAGYQVLAAADGAEAVKLARDHRGPIHVLVTDVIMPGMLGPEVVERTQALRPDVRVLFMSGYAPALLTKRGTLDPGITLVEKPFTEAQLLRRVWEVLDDNH